MPCHLTPLTVEGGRNDGVVHVSAPMWCVRSHRPAERLQAWSAPCLERHACMVGGRDIRGASAGSGDPKLLLRVQCSPMQSVPLFPLPSSNLDPSMFDVMCTKKQGCRAKFAELGCQV
ncbi:hypothetical protein VPH35_051553 [Triticum aestivum]